MMHRIFVLAIVILGSTVVDADLTDCKMTHVYAVTQVKSIGIEIPSNSECGEGTEITCVSLEQINCDSIGCLIEFKKTSECDILITSGTETNNENGSLGRCMQCLEIKVADGVGNAVPTGQRGEIWTRSSTIMTDYFNDSEKTSETITSSS
ncbi:unnamed protein product [Rotaria sordida]|uniref:Uncharacterized protein n=1 Tax=Rotaria sordida TaxID=392033 RepID=A0A815A5G3_9BILA|nr:unnamed protein product [Rotaria sordida]